MKHKIVDANGKEFEISLSDITDMTTDMTDNSIHLEDSEKHSMSSFQPEIVDSEGNDVDVVKLIDEIKNSTAKSPIALDVLFEATHSGVNRNNWNYHSDSMSKDTSTWKFPYAKPLIKNHDMYQEPIGRVRDAYHGVSELNDERDCINVVYRVTDKDAMDKFLDGRYRTMSIGGSVGHVQCSICGKDILKDGTFKFCGHWRGETYAGQKAIWNGRDIEYKEGSVVNNPADDWAQVKKITIINSEENKDSEDVTLSEPVAADSTEEDIYDAIDSLTTEPAGEEGAKDGEVRSEDGESDKAQDIESTEGTSTEDGVSLEDELNSIKEELKARDTEIEELKNAICDLEEANSKMENTNDELEKMNSAIKDELNKSNERFIKLSVAHKSLMAKRIADSELVNGELEDYEDRCNALASMSARDLNALNDNVKFNSTKPVVEDNSTEPTMAKAVVSPVLANVNDKNTIEDNRDDSEKISDTLVNYKDLEESIIESIYR